MQSKVKWLAVSLSLGLAPSLGAQGYNPPAGQGQQGQAPAAPTAPGAAPAASAASAQMDKQKALADLDLSELIRRAR